MDEYERPRKQIRKDATAAKRRGSSVSRGLRSGSLKGKPAAADERIGPAKPSLGVARRTAADTGRAVSGRRDLPLPMERADMGDRSEGRSLRLSLRVEGDQISVVNAIEVDAPARELQPVRGTSFLEVRVGDQVLALEPLAAAPCPKISVRAHNIDRWRCGGRGLHLSRGSMYVRCLRTVLYRTREG